MKYLYTMVIVLGAILLFSCSQEIITNESPDTTTVDGQTGSVSITIRGAATMTRAVGDVTQLIIKLNHEKYPSIQKHADYTGTYTTDTVSSLTIDHVKTGTWELQAYLENASNQIEFYGETTIEITPGMTTNAKVYLEEAGSINAELIIGDGFILIDTFEKDYTIVSLDYDGKNLWATYNTNAYIVDPVSGQDMGYMYVTSSYAITYDGMYFWSVGGMYLNKLDPITGASVESFEIFSIDDSGTGLTFDGEYLWTVASVDQTLSKINPTDGSIVASYAYTGEYINNLSFDGENIIALTDNDLLAINKDTGVIISTTSFPTWIADIAFDGNYVYVCNLGTIFKYEYTNADESEALTSSISGIITNTNGNPVANAAVHITSFTGSQIVKKTAITDSTGRYELTLPALTGTLSVYHNDYDVFSQDITIAGTGTYNAVLSPDIIAAPTDLTSDISEVNGSQIILSWTPINSEVVKGYNIYRATYSYDTYTLVNTEVITGSTWTDTYNLQSNINYYYKIATVNHENEVGPMSNFIAAELLQGYIDSLSIPATDPVGLDFDGTFFWVSADGTDKIYRINAESGSAIEYTAPSNYTDGLAINGNDLWVYDSVYNDLYKLNATDGTVVSTISNSPSMSEGRLVYLNDYLYVYSDFGIIYKLDPATGLVLSSKTVTSEYIYNTSGITTDGTSLFYFEETDNIIVQLNPYNLTEINRFCSGTTYLDITYDGEYFWGLTSIDIKKFKLPIDTGTSTAGDYSLSGYIVDASGDPITDVTVDVVSFATTPVFKMSVTVDDLGFYQLQVPTGINHIEYRHPDYQIRREDLEINGSKQYSIVLIP